MSTRRRAIGFVFLVVLAALPTRAQPTAAPGATRTFAIAKPFLDSGYLKVRKGDVLSLEIDSAYLVSTGRMRRAMVAEIKLDSLAKLGDSMGLRYEALFRKQDSLKTALLGLDSVQDVAFARLEARYFRLDTLLDRSTANTDRAVREIRKRTLQSYATAALLGAVAGYAVMDPASGNRWIGGVAGLAGGVALNALILHF